MTNFSGIYKQHMDLNTIDLKTLNVLKSIDVIILTDVQIVPCLAGGRLSSCVLRTKNLSGMTRWLQSRALKPYCLGSGLTENSFPAGRL